MGRNRVVLDRSEDGGVKGRERYGATTREGERWFWEQGRNGLIWKHVSSGKGGGGLLGAWSARCQVHGARGAYGLRGRSWDGLVQLRYEDGWMDGWMTQASPLGFGLYDG